MEERNITISLEKAKEWYQQGGDLKAVALQAFSEDELMTTFPKSWSEYTTRARYKGNRVNAGNIPGSADYCHFATKEDAEGIIALIQLTRLHDEWVGDWKPDFPSRNCFQCSIMYIKDIISVQYNTHRNRLLTFPNYDLAAEFKDCFKDLLEKAKKFI